ncbi:uncharacterized protein A4U43_C05F15010 [Asparagus officinalis]|uniref:Outer envelope membrane protein 7 n=1 Tax=Asparagus officinalis TaxID=4686 RepID=A0A5P1ESS0_ASPOF|nr:uncharacterized protein A4U43_C05F15010 [Asparagus officinalis]
MERGRRNEREGNALKTTLIVLGGLAVSWLTMETAFKPFLDRIRGSMDRSDPNHDPDSDDDAADFGDAKGKASKEGLKLVESGALETAEVEGRCLETAAVEGEGLETAEVKGGGRRSIVEGGGQR